MFKHTILIVDDDFLILDTLAKQLSVKNVDVQSASTPEQAKALLSKFHPELVLLDLLLTQTDGAQGVIDYMKSEPALADTPIIVLTNLDKPELKQMMAEQGVKEFLIKGQMSLDEIHEKVMSYLEPSAA